VPIAIGRQKVRHTLPACRQASLHRDTRKTQINCTRTAKSAPWFVHYGCVPGLYPNLTFLLTASILKPTQTHFIAGPLGLRDTVPKQESNT